MVENYMDYSSDDCMNLFTEGQKTRMLSFLNTDRLPILNSNKCGTISSLESTNGPIRIEVYPNPARDLIAIKFPKWGQGYSICIINNLGQTLYKKNLVIEGNNITKFDISGLKNGVYQLLISNNLGISSRKLLVLR